jgi:hypothetical protein
MSKEDVQKNQIKKAFEQGKATSIENVDGAQVTQNVAGHGWAEIIEGVPYKEGIEG